MDCWYDRKAAVGSCRFCGRGVCQDHVQMHPYILELYRSGEVTKVLVVEDALFCGACTLRPEPLEVPEIS